MTDVLDTLKKLPALCASYMPGTNEPILIRRGVSGYWPAPTLKSVEAFNARHGITEAQIEAMQVGSIFGWDAPGADPDFK